MKRIAISTLENWQNSPNRKPMLIHGARQVGKTWLMKEFGKNCYKDCVYINFERKKLMRDLFIQDLDPNRLIQGIEIESGKKIDSSTLIIFDEIQENPLAITSLKYFYEEKPELHIIAAGSLLGVALHNGISYPVGKVDTMNLYPLNFCEFLNAIGEEALCKLIFSNDISMIKTFNDKLVGYLKEYMFIGGMPEVVSNYIKEKDFNEVRDIQIEILDAYKNDFSKHVPQNLLAKLSKVWDVIPAQLSKQNKKFKYSDIQKGSRAKDFEDAITWLKNAGLIYAIHSVSKPALPIKSYFESSFKMFMLDVGLLSAFFGLDVRTIIDGSRLFTEFKGALAEQFVLQELNTIPQLEVGYWTSDATAEVDFIIQVSGKVIPLEVKSATNLKSKSLSVYVEKYKPELSIRSSLADFNTSANIFDIPMYAIENLKEIIQTNK